MEVSGRVRMVVVVVVEWKAVVWGCGVWDERGERVEEEAITARGGRWGRWRCRSGGQVEERWARGWSSEVGMVRVFRMEEVDDVREWLEGCASLSWR